MNRRSEREKRDSIEIKWVRHVTPIPAAVICNHAPFFPRSLSFFFILDALVRWFSFSSHLYCRWLNFLNARLAYVQMMTMKTMWKYAQTHNVNCIAFSPPRFILFQASFCLLILFFRRFSPHHPLFLTAVNLMIFVTRTSIEPYVVFLILL